MLPSSVREQLLGTESQAKKRVQKPMKKAKKVIKFEPQPALSPSRSSSSDSFLDELAKASSSSSDSDDDDAMDTPPTSSSQAGKERVKRKSPNVSPIRAGSDHEGDPMEIDDEDHHHHVAPKKEEKEKPKRKALTAAERLPVEPKHFRRHSRHALSLESEHRKEFNEYDLTAVNSRWRPRMKPSAAPMHDGVAYKALKALEREERLKTGLPRNVQPVQITTKFRQYKLTNEAFKKGCRTPKDEKFMDMVTRNGRLLPVERWKRYTLVQGETFTHDLGTFIALDLALVTVILNFYADMRHKLQGRRQKIRISDVQYLIDNVWSLPVVNSYKIWQPQFTTQKAVRLHHRDEEAEDMDDDE